ncbi:hypothetical protein CDCA_CDCA17G4372 [Cyanidium caldarium]|uniref:Ubiquitin-like protease family profile domain-containing protein n=1 Tax=Cyanidium caldarium TaxID=2771 RepID=A0AAV9J170_CYACA|nr:hypothetical protein CDCA_CDCA17G4372 [Cyanidium caldarium]
MRMRCGMQGGTGEEPEAVIDVDAGDERDRSTVRGQRSEDGAVETVPEYDAEVGQSSGSATSPALPPNSAAYLRDTRLLSERAECHMRYRTRKQRMRNRYGQVAARIGRLTTAIAWEEHTNTAPVLNGGYRVDTPVEVERGDPQTVQDRADATVDSQRPHVRGSDHAMTDSASVTSTNHRAPSAATDATAMPDEEVQTLHHDRPPRSGLRRRTFHPAFGEAPQPPCDLFRFPPQQPGSVLLTTSDLWLLQAGGYLNDTVIDFWMKLIAQYRIPPAVQPHVYMASSFLYKKIVSAQQRQPPATRTSASADALFRATAERWFLSRRVDLFERRLVFIPVHHEFHWSLAVLCNLDRFEAMRAPDDAEPTSPHPCILYLDSMRSGSPGGMTKALRAFLDSYYQLRRERRGEAEAEAEDAETPPPHKVFDMDSLPLVKPKVPIQQNGMDCGVYMLMFAERLAADPPICFDKEALSARTAEMFSPSDADLYRLEMERTVRGLAAVNQMHDLEPFP